MTPNMINAKPTMNTLTSPMLAVITTRKINRETGEYYRQENAIALELAKQRFRRRPELELCYEVNKDDKLTLKSFLEDSDDIDDPRTLASKLNMLFPSEETWNGMLKEVVLYVHGFNCSPESARKDGASIVGITDKPVVVFDWASTHSYPFFYVPFVSSFIPYVVKGYAKDAETTTSSVRSFNWLLYILLRGVEKLHIVSHSMGARIVLGSINSIAHDYKTTTKHFHENSFIEMQERTLAHLKTIVLIEPDVDILNASRFVNSDMDTIFEANKLTHVHMYVHERDNPLGVSQEIHYNIQRVGQLCGAKELLNVLQPEEGDRTVPQYFHIINATSCEKKRLLGLYVNPLDNINFTANHSYWEYSQFKNSLREIINNDGTHSVQYSNINTI